MKNATGARALIIDVGLDKGDEFFLAIANGFEVVGFEANPKSFVYLANKCSEIAKCHVWTSAQSLYHYNVRKVIPIS